MKQDKGKTPLILNGNRTISMEVTPIDNQPLDTGETVLLSDNNETVLLQDSNETVLLSDSNETVLLDEAFKQNQPIKHSRELYQLGEGEMLADRYVIGDILGFGGFGITYSAWDTKLDIKVAIKEYYPSNLVNRIPGRKEVEIYSKKQETEFQKGLNRFLGEAQNMAKFSGQKNIVNVYNYFQENGTAYLVMEFLDGMSLKEYTKLQGEKLPYTQVIEYTKCILSALKILHKKHIIHRDISPDNIFICKDGNVKLIDFGAARFAVETDEAKTLSVVLKPGFAPPEQYRSKGKQGPWTDIYALGATMYRIVTGVVPEESVNRAVSDDLKEPKEYVPEIPEYFNNILMKCLAIQPELRFQNVDDLENKLDRRKKVSSVKGELLRRKLKRAFLVSAVLLLLGAFGWKEYEYIKAQQEKATLVESTISVWIPVAKNQDEKEMKELFEKGIADFKTTYPAVTVQVECIPEETYGDKLSEAIASKKAPTVFESSYLADSQKENLADLSDTYGMLDLKSYKFGNLFETLYEKKQLPTGFSIPIVYENTLLSQAEPIYAKENDKTAFLEGTSTYYAGTFKDYQEIQSGLAGIYQMKAVEADALKMEFVNIWGVNSQANQDEINAGVRLLYYMMSEQAQDVWYVQNENGFPLYTDVLKTYTSVNTEMDFLNELEVKNSQISKIDTEYLSSIYESLLPK